MGTWDVVGVGLGMWWGGGHTEFTPAWHDGECPYQDSPRHEQDWKLCARCQGAKTKLGHQGNLAHGLGYEGVTALALQLTLLIHLSCVSSPGSVAQSYFTSGYISSSGFPSHNGSGLHLVSIWTSESCCQAPPYAAMRRVPVHDSTNVFLWTPWHISLPFPVLSRKWKLESDLDLGEHNSALRRPPVSLWVSNSRSLLLIRCHLKSMPPGLQVTLSFCSPLSTVEERERLPESCFWRKSNLPSRHQPSRRGKWLLTLSDCPSDALKHEKCASGKAGVLRMCALSTVWSTVTEESTVKIMGRCTWAGQDLVLTPIHVQLPSSFLPREWQGRYAAAWDLQPLQVSTRQSCGKLIESILHPLPAQDEAQYWHIIQGGFTRFSKMAKAQNTRSSQCCTSWFSESVRRFFQRLFHSRGDLGVITSHLQRKSYNLKLILNNDQFIGVGLPIAKPAGSTEVSKTNVFLLSSKFQVEVETTANGKRQSG